MRWNANHVFLCKKTEKGGEREGSKNETHKMCVREKFKKVETFKRAGKRTRA